MIHENVQLIWEESAMNFGLAALMISKVLNLIWQYFLPDF